MTGFLVVDAGPIITFARAGHLGLLQRVLPCVIIASAVFQEVAVSRPDVPGAVEIREGTWGQRQAVVDPTALACVFQASILANARPLLSRCSLTSLLWSMNAARSRRPGSSDLM